MFLATQVGGLWFFTDEWAFLTGRSLTGSGAVAGLFVPHNEHWSTIPVLVYRAPFHLFGQRTYVPYVAITIGLHLVTSLLLYLLLRCADIHPWAASLAVVVWCFPCGGGAMNVLWAFQMGFLGSAASAFSASGSTRPVDGPACGWSASRR